MTLDLSTAYGYCERMAKSHYENFPVGSLLIPKQKRPYVWSIYAFARSADDFADENYPSRNDFPDEVTWREEIRKGEAKRLDLLQEWESQLQACYEGTPTHPVFVALQKTVRDLKIPMKPLSDLLYAFKMDVTKRRHRNWAEVLHYCEHSANPVGRLVLTTFDAANEERFALSDAICTGLQLANFWQDMAVDREKDRIYAPLDLLARFGMNDETILNPPSDTDWRKPLEALGEFTLDFFKKGAPLPRKVKGRLSWELRCTWLGGMTVLNRACFDPNRTSLERPKIRPKDKLSILWKSIFTYNRCVALWAGA
ncbi:MAG: squalene synthase HpnC [bacterium]